MKINYSKILKKNLINVFKDVLYEIDKKVRGIRFDTTLDETGYIYI